MKGPSVSTFDVAVRAAVACASSDRLPATLLEIQRELTMPPGSAVPPALLHNAHEDGKHKRAHYSRPFKLAVVRFAMRSSRSLITA